MKWLQIDWFDLLRWYHWYLNFIRIIKPYPALHFIFRNTWRFVLGHFQKHKSLNVTITYPGMGNKRDSSYEQVTIDISYTRPNVFNDRSRIYEPGASPLPKHSRRKEIKESVYLINSPLTASLQKIASWNAAPKDHISPHPPPLLFCRLLNLETLYREQIGKKMSDRKGDLHHTTGQKCNKGM